MLEPNEPCPCGSGQKYKRCHGGDPTQSVRNPMVGSDGFDPFAKIFLPDASLDQEYVRKRIPTLVEILRLHPQCYEIRMDPESLTERLLADGGLAVRTAGDQEEFETALQRFSREHLHDLVDPELHMLAMRTLQELAVDLELNRRQRVSAAIGLAILAGVPDESGMRGRAVFDLVFRISLEELHAHEQLRQKANTTEGGLPAAELNEFWAAHPAVRHRYELRYRREVSHVVEQIHGGELPDVVSIDVALRGTETLMRETTAARDEERKIEAEAVHTLLREPFEQDMLDGGAEAVVARWMAALAQDVEPASGDRRALRRGLQSAVRVVADGGPGADVVLYSAYIRAVTRGQFFVRDEEEAAAAHRIFEGESLDPDGVLRYGEYLSGRGDAEMSHRVVMAGIELWPEHEGLRAAAENLVESELAVALDEPHAPLHEEEEEDDEDTAGEESAEE